MLYYDRIHISEGIDIKKTSKLKEHNICLYWYFLDQGFKFQPNVCNGCCDVLLMSMNFSNITILIIHGTDFRCIISGISKGEVVNLLQKADFNEKSGILKIIIL